MLLFATFDLAADFETLGLPVYDCLSFLRLEFCLIPKLSVDALASSNWAL